MTDWGFWTFVATAIYAGFAALQWWAIRRLADAVDRSLGTTDGAIDAANRNATAAFESAEAANKTAVAARESMLLTHRLRIVVRGVEALGFEHNAVPKEVGKGYVLVTNLGSNPGGDLPTAVEILRRLGGLLRRDSDDMAHHVDDGAARIGHKESSDTPRFVREWIYDLEPTRDRPRMDVVNIRDFYTDLGKNRGRIITHQSHLSSRIAGRHQGHD